MRPHLRKRTRAGGEPKGSRWPFRWKRQGQTSKRAPGSPSAAPAPSELERSLRLYLGRVEELRSRGELEEARQLVEEALTAGLTGPALLKCLGRLALGQLARDEYARALEIYERMLEVDARNAEAVAGQALSRWWLGRRREAWDSLDPTRAQAPPDRLREELNGIGEFFRFRAPRKAMEVFDLVLRVEPGDAIALNGRAEALLRAGDREACRRAVDAALVRIPGDAGLHDKLRRLATRDYNEGRLDKALEGFERLVSVARDDTFALRWRAATLRRLGSPDKADTALLEAVARHPEDVGLLVEQGLTYRHLRRFDEALAAFDRALAVRPPLVEAPQAMASCLRRLHRYEEALKRLDDALAQPGFMPESLAWLHHERALIFWDTRQFSKAEAALAEAMAVAPFWKQPTFDRAEMLLRLGRRPEAQELIDALERDHATSPAVQRDLGWYYLRRRAQGKAREKFESLPEGTLDWETGLGGVCFFREDYAAADRHFVRARELNPWDPATLMNLAWALVNHEVPSLLTRAEALCREALVLDPENVNAIECLGIIAARDGRLQEAEDRFLSANRVNPSHGAYQNLATLYVQEGRCREAREQLDLALQYEPDDIAAWIELGNLHWQAGEQREAIQALRRAAAIDPGSAEPYRALALALMQAGEVSEAERLLRKGLRRVDRSRSWRLHLALAQVLRTTADRGNDEGLYEEAHREVQASLRLHEDTDAYFELGYVLARLDALKEALAAFQKCGEDHAEAMRNAARIRATLEARKEQTRGGTFASVVLGAAALTQLLAVWVLFLLGRFKDETKPLVFSPILLALLAVAALLPWLTRLKLPGIEAELAEPKQSLTPGQKGGITLSSAVPTITRAP